MSDEFIEKKSKLKVILTILIILVILGSISYFGYSFIKKEILNPKKYLENIKENLVNSISNRFNSFEFNSLGKESKETGSITYKTKSKEMDYFNHLSINYDILTSLDKEEIQTSISLNEDSKSILNGNIYLQKDKIYLDSKDLYNKTLLISKLDSNIFNLFKEYDHLSIKDIESIINNYFNYMLESIYEANMKSEFVDLFKVKYSYEIDKNNVNKVQNKFDELIDKDETLKLLLKENNMELDIKFYPIKIEIVRSIGTGEIYNLVIDGEDISFELERDKNDRSLYHVKDGESKGTLKIDRDTYILQMYENEALKYTINLTNNKELFRFSATDEEMNLSFSLKNVDKNTLNITFTIKMDDEENIDLSGTIKKESNGYTLSSKTDINLNDEKITMNLNCNIEYDNNLLTTVEINDYQEYDKLSENEVNSIYENLYKKLNGTKLLDLLNNDNYA